MPDSAAIADGSQGMPGQNSHGCRSSAARPDRLVETDRSMPRTGPGLAGAFPGLSNCDGGQITRTANKDQMPQRTSARRATGLLFTVSVGQQVRRRPHGRSVLCREPCARWPPSWLPIMPPGGALGRTGGGFQPGSNSDACTTGDAAHRKPSRDCFRFREWSRNR